VNADRQQDDAADRASAAGSLPDSWEALWGPRPASELAERQLAEMKETARSLAEDVPLDRTAARVFGPLVGAKDLRTQPVHRWFSYKEGFSPNLPGKVLDRLNLGTRLVVADPFGGVATTALSLRDDPRVAEVHSVEWSPLACWVGQTKLRAKDLDSRSMELHINRALASVADREVEPPGLGSFANGEIFPPSTLRTLLNFRETIRTLPGVEAHERDFLMLGLCAALEDCSGVMKDGRALRILRGRKRTPSSLASPGERKQGARAIVKAQWRAMLADLRGLESGGRQETATGVAGHWRGDARELSAVINGEGAPVFGDASVDAFIYSPPYLNAIDYSEVYKLELWFMQFLETHRDFRTLREGTLRSHPSIRFEDRYYFDGHDGDVIDHIDSIATWVSTWSARPENGPVVKQYFEDMFAVLREQARVLRPGGAAVCVVANSTYAQRQRTQSGVLEEQWRIPLLTDVLLAHLGRLAGFVGTEIWHARELRPRNVRAGHAREALVVLRKGSG
jgi:hypothetical protein